MTAAPSKRIFSILENSLKCLVLAIAFNASALAQFQAGTVSVLITSPNGTVVAADSRNHPLRGKISDDLCKILTFGNKVAVTLGGVSAHTSPQHPIREWDGFKQLTLAYIKQSSSTQAFADEWANEMRTLILHDVSDNPLPLINALDGWNGSRGTVLTGIFVGSDDLEGLAVMLTLDKAGNGYQVLLNPLRHPSHSCDFACAGVGAEIIDEIVANTTARAQNWHRNMERMPPSQRAIEAIRLTIQHYPRPLDVGGKIDAVMVSKNGIHWIQRKPNCPAGE